MAAQACLASCLTITRSPDRGMSLWLLEGLPLPNAALSFAAPA